MRALCSLPWSSAFFWLVTLFVISSLFRGASWRRFAALLRASLLIATQHPFALPTPPHLPLPLPCGVPAAWAPLTPEPGPYAGLLLVAVLIQEVARVGVWRFHRQAEHCAIGRTLLCCFHWALRWPPGCVAPVDLLLLF